MKIGNMEVIRGQKTKGYIHTGWVADCAEVRVPVMAVSGEQDGPTLWINAGVHGEELSGIPVIHRVFDMLDPKTLKGTVIATPGCNPLGIRASNKFTNEDQLDMDQQFPGNPDGWLSQQMAYHFFEEVKGVADYFIDFHALGGFNAVPYTVFKSLPQVSEKVNQDARNMALLFGAEWNCFVDLSTATGELPGSTFGALDIQCALNGIPCIMAELGAGNRIVWENVEIAVKGVFNNLIYMGMLDGELPEYHGQKIVTKRRFPNTHTGGLVMTHAKLGSVVRAGTVVATVINYLGETLEEIKFDQDIAVIGMIENPVAYSGKVTIAAGLEWQEIN